MRRGVFVRVVFCLIAAAAGWPAAGDHDVAPEGAPPPLALDGRVPIDDRPAHQFDFWLGSWDVQNRHLREAGWVDSGKATARIQSVAGGRAVLEQWNGELGGNPLIGFSLRGWDGQRWPTWLYWHGGGLGAWGEMHGVREGRTMVLSPPGGESPRYTFSDAYRGSARWSESRVDDAGKWTTTWIMDFRRTGPAKPLSAATAEIVPLGKSAERLPNREVVERLIGKFEGKVSIEPADGEARTVDVRGAGTSMTDGAGVLLFVDFGSHQVVNALAYDGRRQQWMVRRATSQHDGITAPRVEMLDDGVRLSLEGGWVERWTCEEAGACRWSRRQEPVGGHGGAAGRQGAATPDRFASERPARPSSAWRLGFRATRQSCSTGS